MKHKEAQADSEAQARCDTMKKTINILSVIDIAVIALWAVALAFSRIFPETEFFSAAFVIIYAIAILTVLLHTIISVILLIKKKSYSLPLLISAYAINFAWTVILVMLIDYAKNIF